MAKTGKSKTSTSPKGSSREGGGFSYGQQWYESAFIALGPGRTVALLHEKLKRELPNEKHPSLSALTKWATQQKWFKLAGAYDRGVIQGNGSALGTARGLEPGYNPRKQLEIVVTASLGLVGEILGNVATKALEEQTIDHAIRLQDAAGRGIELYERLSGITRQLELEERQRKEAESRALTGGQSSGPIFDVTPEAEIITAATDIEAKMQAMLNQAMQVN